jgi:hypothetical protein
MDGPKSLSSYASVNSVSTGDKLVIIGNGGQNVATIDVFVFTSNVIHQNTPANSTALTVSAGTILYDNNYVYVAVSNNKVLRAALSSF